MMTTKKEMAMALHEKAKQTAKHYLRLEKELLEIIIQIDKTKTFYKFGYNSLFTYVTEGLKLSPATAYSFIKVARKSHEIPELKKEVMDGKLSISKAQKMTQVLTQENHKKWFDFAEKTTHRKLEREVALASPKQSVIEKACYVHPTEPVGEKVQLKRQVPRVALQVGVSEELMLKIRQAQDIESQRQRKSLNLEDTLEAMVEVYLNQKDPVRKAKRQKLKGRLQKTLEACHENQRDHENQREKGIQKEKKNQKKTSNSSQLTFSESVSNSSQEEFLSIVRQKSQQRPNLEPRLQKPQPRLQEPPEKFQESLPGKTQQKLQRKPQGKSQEESQENLQQRPQKFQGKFQRKPIKASVIHQVHLRDEGQCTYYDKQGRRCSSRRFLETHHKKPVSQGGDNSFDNLRLLCSGHHKVCHISNLGL